MSEQPSAESQTPVFDPNDILSLRDHTVEMVRRLNLLAAIEAAVVDKRALPVEISADLFGVVVSIGSALWYSSDQYLEIVEAIRRHCQEQIVVLISEAHTCTSRLAEATFAMRQQLIDTAIQEAVSQDDTVYAQPSPS